MKKLLLIVLILALVTPVMAQDTTYDKILLAGARYDNDKFLVSYGYAAPLGKGFYEFLYTDIGTPSGAFNAETAYLFDLGAFGLDNFYIGPLAGPNADWINNEVTADPVSYITGATGLAVSYAFTDRIGLGAIGKYKFSIENNNQYIDGWTAGIAFWLRL